MATKPASQRPARSIASNQVLRQAVSSNINSFFKSTLGTENDIVNIVMALCHLESRFNVSATGKPIPIATSTSASDYMNSDPVRKILQTGDASQVAFVKEGVIAQGVMQVMGWNFVRGGSAKDKKCLIELYRPDLAYRLCVNAGDSISYRILGENNIDNAVLAGLVVLESKYKESRQVQTRGGWRFGSKGGVFNSKLGCAIGAYLGVGAKDVVTGITPADYSAGIIGGSHYKIANGADSPALTAVARNSTAAAAGPATNGETTGPGASIPGCTA